ncbi:hypothetical protein C7212DRAFT_362370 [Tuber magnatum]|uniref:F-box domain-containing protein n=1 Tax=Tuber magnatum TaxID=42249 RepID=A0A317SU61_9PEZI|nr:hypothetical protein C7212DRAFT_362370 [Tuber magnatum]
MSFQHLPAELHLEIASLLSNASLAALSRTCRILHDRITPVLWSHLQFGRPTPPLFKERAFPAHPSLPCVGPLPAGGNASCVERHMDERGVLAFYSAVRKGLIRNESLALVRSLELRDCVLGARFASGGGYPVSAVGDGELCHWRELRNGDFVGVFGELLKERRIRGLKCISIVYGRSPNFEGDFTGNGLKSVQKAQDLCRIVGAYAAMHPLVQVKISTTHFALVHALFTDLAAPLCVTSLKTSIYRRPTMLETFRRYVLPTLGTSLEHLTLLTAGPGSGFPSSTIWDHYSGAYFHVTPGVFDDRHFFSNFQFAKLKSVEYSAELFTFAWAPSGIRRLCVRHSRIVNSRWWRSLAKQALQNLEKLEIWYDCNSPIPGGAQPPPLPGDDDTPADFSICFRDLKALAIARNPPHRESFAIPEESVASMHIREAIMRANADLEEVFLENGDVETLTTLCSRGRLRSLTVQSTLHRPFQDSQIIRLIANLQELAWLHICVQDGHETAFPTLELLNMLAKHCVKLPWVVMEDRGFAEVPGMKDFYAPGMLAPMTPDQYECLSASCRRPNMAQVWVFRLDLWRERNR